MNGKKRLDGATYILPIRMEAAKNDEELSLYLDRIGELLEVIVVDGSPPDVFEANGRRWRSVRHVAPLPHLDGLNGKVRGVITGIQLANHERLVIADDDVRYDEAALEAVVGALDTCEIVRPQNYFEPRPWHAVWDSGRSLLNRLQGGDWPGTLAARRSAVLDGYDGDVLFENLELVRTVQARGGRELVVLDLFVRRKPPELSQFLNQRVRQAYDEFARPGRLLLQLSWLPLQLWLLVRRPAALPSLYLGVAALAEAGRQTAGGTNVFPLAASLAAPLWFVERSVCAWLALGSRLLAGGVQYRGGVIAVAAHSPGWLRAQSDRQEREQA
jgi:hypothetical protein